MSFEDKQKDWEVSQMDGVEEMILDEDAYLKGAKPRQNVFQRLLGIFYRPAEVFEDIARAPRILMPLVVIMVITALVTYLNFDHLLALQKEMYIKQITAVETPELLTPERIEGMAQMATWALIWVTGIGFFLTALVKSAFIRIIATFSGGQGTFKQVFSGVLHASIILVLNYVLAMGVMAIFKVDTLDISPAMFLGVEAMGTPLYTVLSAFNLFSIWYLGVSALCVKEIEGLSWSKAIVCVVLPYVIYVAFQLFAGGMVVS